MTRSCVPLIAMLALVATIGLAGCENDGGDGPAGPGGGVGPTGPTGPGPVEPPIDQGGSVTIGDGSALTPEQIQQIGGLVAKIDSASIAGNKPVLVFTLETSHGGAVLGLEDTALFATVAKLVPAAGGVPSRWQSYVNRTQTAFATGPQVLPSATQADAEYVWGGNFGTLEELGDGQYRYTYNVDLTSVTSPIAVAYEPSATHRLGFEIRLGGAAEPLAPDNPVKDFVPDGGAGSGHKLIAATANCNTCHARLEIHGGPRRTTEYCATCHNPGTIDPDGGESVDLAYMVHSIHTGVHRRDWNAPPTFPPLPYKVWGYGNAEQDFSDVTYPQPLSFCENCHTASDTHPDGNAWLDNASASACGGCHAYGLERGDYNTSTGQYTFSYSHSPPISFVAPDGTCKDCHRASGVAGDVGVVHSGELERQQIELGEQFVFEVLAVTNVGKGKVPSIKFKVAKPDGTPYDLATDPAFQGADATLNLYVAWDTSDITNADPDTGTTPAGERGAPYRMRIADIKAFAVRDPADGTYTTDLKTAAVPGGIALPVETANVMAAMDGHPVVAVPGVAAPVQARAHNAVKYSATERVRLVSEAKCNDCHVQISAHGSNRNGDPQGCLVCHNASSGWSDDARIAGPIALGAMIHNIHASKMPAFADITYPQRLANCEACHLPGTYNTARTAAVAISTGPGADLSLYTDDTWVTATAGTCGTCHDSAPAKAHMGQNGGAFDVVGDKSLMPSSTTEACAVCHGAGRSVDTVKAHAE